MATAAVYKWRITNAKYIYLIDEDRDKDGKPIGKPFIYDINEGIRTYSKDDDPVYEKPDEINTRPDEIIIKENVNSLDKEAYKYYFEKMSGLLKTDIDGRYLHLLDYSAYLKDIPECVEGATDVTCNPIDILFTADAMLLSSGETATVLIEDVVDIQLPNGSRQRTFNINFGIPAGKDGTNGTDGLSAYEIAVKNGFTGTTEEQWLDSLQGEKGPQGYKGDIGKSAYDIASENGFSGTERQWVLSLKGDKGDDGTIGINKVQEEIIYKILGYDTSSNDSNISYFPYVYNKFISKPIEGESEFYLSNADKDIYEYKRTYYLTVELENSAPSDYVVNPINGYQGRCLRYNNNINDKRMFFYNNNGEIIYTASNNFSDTKDSFEKLHRIYEIAKTGEYTKSGPIETYTSDNIICLIDSNDQTSSNSKIKELRVEVETTVLKPLKSDFIVNNFDKILIKPESELNSNIQLNSAADENTPIKYSNITQKLDNTSIEHYLLKSEEGFDNEYESIMKFNAKSLNIDLLKNDKNVCDITIGNDNFEINKGGKNIFKVTSKLATFKPEVQAKVNGINDVYLGVPIGTIVMWPLENPPIGWLICNGTSYNRNNPLYSKLYDVIKRKYTADSVLNPWFQVPDLVQKFPLGAANSDPYKLGATGGESTHKLTEKEMPPHSHQLTEILVADPDGKKTWKGVNFNGGNGGTMDNFVFPEGEARFPETEVTGGGQAHNNMPPFLTLNFIIKYM